VYSEATANLKVPFFGLKPFGLPFTMVERSFLFIIGFSVTEDPKINDACLETFWVSIHNNDNILRRFHETVKDAVDPKGILSAGRYGIWPKLLREKTK
jgi:4-cresol dehydrogenase (hydroxylating)